MDMDASSSSSGSDDDESDTTVSTTLTTNATSTTTESSASESSESTESSGDDDASSDSGSSSGGDKVVDYALAFDGTSYARQMGKDPLVWPSTNYTVELWLDIKDEAAQGVIFDSTTEDFTSGWVIYLHDEWRVLVFSFFDENHQNQVVMGPAIEDIGTGWHHIAATKNGESVLLHVDGVATTAVVVPSSMSFVESIRWSLGGNASDNPSARLSNAAVDDVRITGAPVYQENFDPPVTYVVDDATILLLLLDTGEGVIATDEISGVNFAVENPAWISGNAE